ncbi:D-amino-acid dehydrogenase [Salinimicrobium marinum]|uniref:D-amino-acid dehydrogenase n=1 Tax=Salinimicrobium marinum TaxID=680283 RepID=A0A918W251_9FLAO|nr:FAD-binding oxidoreductase [Salinimicrobium marinum]GHA47625.1 D-amino-acid dehydrogenase [Salinimicrobium marinum]
MKKVVIIGGGISGLCSAYYLLKEGYEVTLLEKKDLSEGASVVNAGYNTPRHIIPLAAPGMVNQGLKWMWKSTSPFYIKPRWNLEFFDWAWKFKKSSTKAHVERSIPVLKEISLKSNILYEEILETVDFDTHYRKDGLLTVFQTEKAKKTEIEKGKMIQSENLDVEVLSKNEVLDMQPVLDEKILGAVYYKCDAHSTPGDFISRFGDWLTKNGADLIFNEEVIELIRKGNDLVSVKTSSRNYEADLFVLAAGSWSPQLTKTLGLKIPIQGGKGYSMDVYRETGITLPAILAESKVAVTPMDGFTRFAGTMEFSGNNDIIRKERVGAIAKAAKDYYKNIELTMEEMDNARSGLRPVSPDGLPFIGKTSRYNNLIIAAGHAMIGWSLGAVTGKLVSQIATGRKPSVNLYPFRPDRFF